MAIDFMTALRARARSQERGARLSGRPLTQAETVAPYVAMAETAGDRASRNEALRLEQVRLDEAKRAEEARIAEQRRITDLQAAEAERARKMEERQGGISGAVAGGYAGSIAGPSLVSAFGGGAGAGIGAAGGAAGGAAIGTGVGAALGAGAGVGASAAGGAGLGAAAGLSPLTTAGSFAGPIGAFVGAALGFVLGKGGCIIISACTNPHSYEVNLSREYRDRFMGPVTLIGYYALASILAPIIDKLRPVRWVTRAVLVSALVDYGEYILGHKAAIKRGLSRMISKAFLGLCKIIGKGVIKIG